MGTDVRVADAARVSFKKIVPDGILREGDQKLINYLARHGHWTPFGHVQITLWQKMPIFVARQFAKHTVGFVTNEVSRRYVDDVPEFFVPDIWRKRPEGSVKQGSSDEKVEMSYKMQEAVRYYAKEAATLYEELIRIGVAPEQARMVLPQSMYTEMYTTGSLAAWARAYKLRSDPHSQKEIQYLAELWNGNISQISGLRFSWEALTT
jgi:thymidylate synthase (FAD)